METMGILWSIITLLSVIGIFAGLTMLFVHRKNDQQKRQSKIIFFGSIIALFASGFIFSNIDQADANKTRINHNEITYQQLNREVSKLQDQKESLSTEISDLKDDHHTFAAHLMNNKA
jgi:septal ring factor EnvC (AmiA/AmiB activator)